MVIRGVPGPSAASRQNVLRAAADLDFRPDPTARTLRRQRSGLLGVLFTAGEPFHAELLEALYPAAEQCGYEVVLSAVLATRTENRAVESLVTSRCEGLILLGPQLDSADLAALAAKLPVTVVGRSAPDAGVDSIHTADAMGSAAAVDLLVSLGHERIAHVDGGRRPGSAERRRGYRTAMRRRGLQSQVRVIPGDHDEEAGVRAAHTLLAEPGRHTAVLAGNDRCAVGLLDTLRRAGVQVPTDVSIVGYDDSRLARLPYIDLTSVQQDAPAMARLAVDTIGTRLRGDSTGAGSDDTGSAGGDVREILLDPRLIVRGTTAPAPSPRHRPAAG
jgi:DNA-binding LacI/PurR family transcriptional regulator